MQNFRKFNISAIFLEISGNISADRVGRLSEAEAALSKSEKLLSELSGMPLVLHDDIEGWTIKLCLAIGRCVSTIVHIFCPNVF